MSSPDADLIRLRMRNQRLVRSDLRSAAAVVSWLVAVQSQDYPGAKWGVGLRAMRDDDRSVDAAFDAGDILRTHVMRPTWHFVAPADIRWLLALTAPRVHAFSRYQYRKLELDARTITRSRTLVERALLAHRSLTRNELGEHLRAGGVEADGQRLAYVVMHHELDGVICSGPRRGKQFTYALLDERVAAATPFSREEALVELTRRYFTSRGLATLKDFVWWSGLTVADAKTGVALAGSSLVRVERDGRIYWSGPAPKVRKASTAPAPDAAPVAYLLPNYDELGIAYAQRDTMPSVKRPAHIAAEGEFVHLLMIDAELVGRWRRTAKASSTSIELQLYRAIDAAEARALDEAIERYRTFVDTPVIVSFSGA